MKLKTAKGTRDFNPEEEILRSEIIGKLKRLFENYGFSPIDTPILERYETLASKFAGGEEILKETFSLKDQGQRKLGLRYDLTIPLARFISMNPQLKMPFKRYQVGKVLRDGPISTKRLREFTQLDADVIGSKSLMADAEIIKLASEFFSSIKLKFKIRINNRKILEGILDEIGIAKNKRLKVILSIDKLGKQSENNIKAEIKRNNISQDKVNKLFRLIKSKNLKLKNDIGIKELNEVLKYCKLFKIKNLEVDYSLARGLNYYTGTIFEIFVGNLRESSASGGRYDDLIGGFAKKNIPAVGISFGLDRICLDLEQDKKTVVDVLIIPIKTERESIKVLMELRKNKINADMDFNQRSLSKNLDYANKLKIPYVLIIGSKEVKSKKYTLKDMKSGKEKLLKQSSLVRILAK